MLEFFNSKFIDSTVRDDDGIKGAIFVDSILLRESELDYPDKEHTKQKIPLSEITNETFLNNLKGLLVFDEHPPKMINSGNYNAYAGESVGSIVNAEYRNIDGDNVVYGVLRITNPKMVEEVRSRHIRGGSLGYYAKMENDTQTNLKPNHFCLTHSPRDKGVVIFNSNQNKGDTMDLKENEVVVSKSVLNSFINQIGNKIVDKGVKAVLNSKTSDLDRLNFLDSVLSIQDIFTNSECENKEKEDVKKESADEKENSILKGIMQKIEELEKKNSELSQALESKEKEDEKAKDDEVKENEDEKAKDDEVKENEDEKGKEVENKECNNSVPVTNSSNNSKSVDEKMCAVLSRFSY